MKDKLLEALGKLDVANDNHWTADGLPRLDTLKMLMSDGSITRATLDEHAPGYNRESARAAATGAAPTAPQVPPAPTTPPAAPAAPALPASASQPPQAPIQGGDNAQPLPNAEGTPEAKPASGVAVLTAPEAEPGEVDGELDAEGVKALDAEIAEQTAYLEKFAVGMDEAQKQFKLEQDKLDQLLIRKERGVGKELPMHLQYLRAQYGQ